MFWTTGNESTFPLCSITQVKDGMEKMATITCFGVKNRFETKRAVLTIT